MAPEDGHHPIAEHLSPDIIDFLHQWFRKDAKLRPDAKNLLMHPWIKNFRKFYNHYRGQVAELGTCQ